MGKRKGTTTAIGHGASPITLTRRGERLMTAVGVLIAMALLVAIILLPTLELALAGWVGLR